MKKWQLLAGAAVLGLATAAADAGAAVLVQPETAPGPRLVQLAAAYPMSYSARNVQILLGQLGYEVGTPDGVIGPRSRAAIRAFQTDAGLPPSGEPSLALFGKLQEAVAEQSQPSTPAQPAPAAPSAELVGGIQGELSQRGYFVPSTSGQLDNATIAAIRQYQAAAGLPVTGQPSQALLTSLQSAPRSAAATSQARKEQVVAMQRALNDRGFDAGPEDGAIGPKVRAAIRAFQASNGMRVTGEVSPELLTELGVIPGGSGPVAGTPPQGGTGTGSGTDSGFGLSSEQVLELEQSLTALGYKVGRVDGVYDGKTRQAIIDYQDDNAVTEDGLATPSLLASVRSNLAARTGGSTSGGRGEMSSSQILALQQSLSRQGYYFGSGSGIYDAQTEAAVRGYQRDAGLPVTGNADAMLLARLQSQGSTQAAASPAVVRAIEDELSRKGYRVGPIDGQNDAYTQAAIDDFLRHNQLRISRAPSEQLLAAIRSSRMTAQEGARRFGTFSSQ